ncbi:sigma-70 family RNA polymerase sigma factor [bacterium]|nr:sigma-70 family RNA polymerase sigma factor [bacterium]
MKSENNEFEKTDEVLMLEYLQGDSRAFDVLYERHADKVYGYLRQRLGSSPLIDDIHQNIFLKFHQVREKYRSPLPVLPWLFTITRTVMLDALRAEKKGLIDLDRVSDESRLTPQDSGTIGEVLGVAALSCSQQRVIEFRYQDDLSFEQIAELLQTSPANVRQLLSRGIRKLQALARRKGSLR